MALHPWFQRSFTFDLPLWMRANLIERLRGTPARLEDRLRSVAPPALTRRHGEKWSAQENAGHLLDLEPLWASRVDDFDAGRTTLTPTDVENRRTHEAHHNDRALADLLAAFRHTRLLLVARLERAPEQLWAKSSLHPRLGTPMRLLDLAFFVAEHDDHHLVCIAERLDGR